MAVTIIKSRKVLINGMNVSRASKECNLNLSVEQLDGTNFDSSGTKIVYPGMQTGTLDINGFMTVGDTSGTDQDWMMFETIGNEPETFGTDNNFMICPSNASSTGDLAYYGQFEAKSYDNYGAVGEIAPFSFSADVEGAVSRGTIIFDRDVTSVSSAVGAVQDLSAMAANTPVTSMLQLHSFSGAGTIKCYVYASCSSAYGSGASPTLVCTFTSKTNEGSQQTSGVCGTSNQHFYWLQYFSSGVNGSVTVAVAPNYGK